MWTRKRFVDSFAVFFIFTASICFADTYRCKSADGTIQYTDRYCGEEAELVVKQSLPGVDEAVGVAIRPSKNEFSATTYEDYLIGEAKRIGRSILPDQRFVDARILRTTSLKCPSTGPEYFDRPEPEFKFKDIQGWGIVLHYGPDGTRKVWQIQLQFHETFSLDDNGERHGAMLLDNISIKKSGAPFTPRTVRNAKRLELMETGVWNVRR